MQITNIIRYFFVKSNRSCDKNDLLTYRVIHVPSYGLFNFQRNGLFRIEVSCVLWQEEEERQEAYFDTLEQVERMERKMDGTMEQKVKTVTCKQVRHIAGHGAMAIR